MPQSRAALRISAITGQRVPPELEALSPEEVALQRAGKVNFVHAAQRMTSVEVMTAQVHDVDSHAQVLAQGVNRVLHVHGTAAQPVNFGDDQMFVLASLQQVKQGRAFGALAKGNSAADVVLQKDGVIIDAETVGLGPLKHVGFLGLNGLLLTICRTTTVEGGQFRRWRDLRTIHALRAAFGFGEAASVSE